MPLTMRQHEANLRQPAFCELLPIRDYLDNVIVRSNGALVAGYDLGGINSYYHSDETRNQTKFSLEALVRSLTERSMRMQVRFEVVEGLGDLPAHYRDQLRSDNPVVQSLDRVRLAAWKQKEQSGFYRSLAKPKQARNFKDLKGLKCRYTLPVASRRRWLRSESEERPYMRFSATRPSALASIPGAVTTSMTKTVVALVPRPLTP